MYINEWEADDIQINKSQRKKGESNKLITL